MNCRTKLWLITLLIAALVLLAAPAFAQTCLQEEYNTVQKQKLNCTANDVRVAQVTNIRDLNGNPLSTCIEGETFSFVADFNIVTTANAANSGGRDNVGLYFQTDPTKPDALFGTCVDNIIAPQHPCSGVNATCGTAGYQEFDASPDNCGDTASSVNPNIVDTIVVTDFHCEAPAGSTTLVLPNCTSWQVPGSSNLCQSSPPNYPYPAPPAAIPGSPSKCNCAVIPLPITPVTPTVIVQKACTTAQTPGPAAFTQNPNTQSPVSCNVGDGQTTETGVATYTVAITNTTGTSGITIDQICDSAYGTVYRSASFTGPACAAGTNGVINSFVGCSTLDIPPTGTTTATCSFTAGPQPELTTVTDTATISGHADLNTSRTFTGTSNQVTVTSTELSSAATITKSVDSLRAGCVTVRYNVDVHNSSPTDEDVTLTALTDSPDFGQIVPATSPANPKILATTCSVPQTLIAGAPDYQCTFDAQICGNIGSITLPGGGSCLGISHVNKVTGTMHGDEGTTDAVTQTANTLTVNVCFTHLESSTTP